MIPATVEELHQLAGQLPGLAGEYDPGSGWLSDRGRDLLVAQYTDGRLEHHEHYDPANRLFQTVADATGRLMMLPTADANARQRNPAVGVPTSGRPDYARAASA